MSRVKRLGGGKKKEYLQVGLGCVQRLIPGCHCENLDLGREVTSQKKLAG